MKVLAVMVKNAGSHTTSLRIKADRHRQAKALRPTAHVVLMVRLRYTLGPTTVAVAAVRVVLPVPPPEANTTTIRTKVAGDQAADMADPTKTVTVGAVAPPAADPRTDKGHMVIDLQIG